MKKTIKIFIRMIYFSSNFGAWISVFCLFALSAMVAVATLSRYFLNRPLLGVDEISGYLNVLIGFLALAYTLTEGRHVRVDIVTKRLPRRTKNALEIVTSILALVLIGQFMRTGWYTWTILIKSAQRSEGYLRTPLDIPYGFMMLGWLLLLLVILLHLGKALQALRGNGNVGERAEKLNHPIENE